MIYNQYAYYIYFRLVIGLDIKSPQCFILYIGQISHFLISIIQVIYIHTETRSNFTRIMIYYGLL